MGSSGTARGQLQLRQLFVFTGTHALLKPEVLVARAQDKFDANGVLTDAETRRYVGLLLEALAAWTERLRSRAP